MDDNNTNRKLHQNTTRVVGLSVPGKIRKIVDRLDEQDRRDKKHLVIIFIIIITLFITAAYFFINSGRRYQHIQTNIGNTIHALTFLS